MLNVSHYGIEEGLSHRDVQTIHQDKQGFIWLGTNYGLNRFDGYNFKWFTKEKHGLQSNIINHIIEDDEGWLWLFFTTNRLFKSPLSIDCFNPITEEVLSFEDKFGEAPPFEFKNILSFASAKDGRLAMVTKQKKLIIYSYEKGFEVSDLEVFPFTLNCFSKHNTVFGDYAKTDSITKNEVVEVGLDGKMINHYEHDYPYQINVFAGVDQSDNLWYILKHATDNNQHGRDFIKGQIFKINAAGKESKLLLKQTALPPNSVDLDIPIFAYKYQFWINPGQNSFWLFGESSFQVFHPESGWYRELSSTYPWLQHLNMVYFDNKNRAWVGTEFGFYVIELNPNPFRRIGYQKSETGFQPYRGITEDAEHNFWVCSDRGTPGLAYFRANNNQYEVEYITGKDWTRGYRYGIFTDSDGFIWLAAEGQERLAKYGAKSNNVQLIPHSIPKKRAAQGVNIWSFHQDKKGTIWFGTDAGVVGYVNDDQTVDILPELEGVNSQGGCIYQFLEYKNGKTWIATDKGLFILETDNKIIYRYESNQKTETLPFLERGVFHIHRDNDSSFWMGTRGLGLIHWQPGTDTYKQFTKADGLSNNTIYAVYGDDYENLWMTSDYGIIQFNKSTKRTTAYLEEDGITHNEFNRISHFKSKDGTLLFGGLNGITAFQPKDLVGDSINANIPMVLTGFQQFDGKQNGMIDKTLELQQSKRIRLAPNDRFFRLEFALLEFSDIGNIQYAYQIAGVDEDWTYQKENSIRFSRLPYGEHKLRIKGQASNGQWSPNELTINVSVLKPFYLKNWFVFLSVFSLFSGAFIFYKWRTSQLKNQKVQLELEVDRRTKTIREQAEELKSLEKLKSRFFANVSHELRTPLTLLLGPVNSIIKRDRTNETDLKLLQYAQRNGNQLMKLINEILDLSKLENDKLEVVEEPVEFFNYLKDQTAQFHSFGTSERVHFEVDFQANKTLNILLDKNKFEKILHNYLSNALKFTPPEGSVILKVNEIENNIRISVADTGRGIHADDLPFIFDRFYQAKKAFGIAEGGTGIGLSLCKELAQLLGGKVWVESEFGKGSTFYFEFPKKIVPSSQLYADGSEPSIPNILEEQNLGTEKSIDRYIDSQTTERAGLASSNLQSTTPKGQADNPKGASRHLTTILLVEDNKDLREYLQFLLSDYQVITAENGKAALELLTQPPNPLKGELPPTDSQLEISNPQLIISDLMMPIMDGFEFLETLKADDRWRHIPVIMLTAKVNIKAKLKALRIGVDDYLNKPFAEEELKARIENLLNNYRERMAFAASIADSNKQNNVLEAERPIIGQVDSQWLQEVEAIFSKNLSDSKFKMDLVAFKLNLSQRQMSRRLKQLTGLNPSHYLQEMRLQTAKEMLITGKFSTVKETGFAVGFRDTQYFSERFQERFGVVPSSYIR